MSWKWRTKKTVSICDTWGCCSSKNLRREAGLLLLICWLKRNVHFGFVFWLIFATVAYRVKEREYPKLHFRCKMRWFFSWTKRRRFLQTLVFEMVYNWTKKRVRRVRTWPADWIRLLGQRKRVYLWRKSWTLNLFTAICCTITALPQWVLFIWTGHSLQLTGSCTLLFSIYYAILVWQSVT